MTIMKVIIIKEVESKRSRLTSGQVMSDPELNTRLIGKRLLGQD